MCVPFFILVLGTLEISYDLYTQAALDSALYLAVRSLETGNAQNVVNSSSFISTYLCPNAFGLLECNSNMFINVQKFVATQIGSTSATTDYWNITTGAIPVVGHTLNLAAYQGTANFCNVAPDQFILVSVIYVGPTFVGGLLPNVFSVTYNGSAVHATLSTLGIATERFPPTGAPSGVTVAPSC